MKPRDERQAPNLTNTLDEHFERIEKYKTRAATDLSETLVGECLKRVDKTPTTHELKDIINDVALAIRPLL